ncbi:hypothetical protein SEA_DIRTMONSTER_63 [Mycobacterium phage DirtMonster]|uniref:Lipoprotein n=11 Tax=Bixzunavirus TaxID=680114 RepID=R4TA56_9CAUD|nr:hypothetical protein M182_gp070 [Mycobacterium phage Astraea]YP_009014662.1 hypothetical protein LINSTU_68 [Mycobacterium phage LinStu]YP_009204628.1 hypothetical protein HYRO_63 [Mycobacterium phage HyRo]YP_009216327.1 hypothetical protein ALICE_62 [Mycobacterium phage Alice]YP_009608754.1 hypothetical protein FDI20_gp069 [Mycobacterium phage Sebata]YP_010057243.1 hypothetical protein KHO59_gp058 [Mycobacterium phage Cane17]YP_010057474.1 hypothetical protein KHO60_gp066 [Mycobacterium ph
MTKILATIASVAVLSACAVQAPAAPEVSTPQGRPFIEKLIEDLKNPPTTTVVQPTTIADMLLPPDYKG